MNPTTLHLPVKMMPQPDETTCGPTCLDAVYRYWGEDSRLAEVIARTRKMERGGTFAIFLACDALRHGYQATIYTYNLMVFDPTWFVPGVDIAERLQRQRELKKDARQQHVELVTEGYLEFLRMGGQLRLIDLSRSLIHGLLHQNMPVITGLSSTFLYRAAREYGPDDEPDDVRGFPTGHFVVIAGYDRKESTLMVADPYGRHPYGSSHEYWINIDRVLGAVLLGMVTHDANLLVIHPPNKQPAEHAAGGGE